MLLAQINYKEIFTICLRRIDSNPPEQWDEVNEIDTNDDGVMEKVKSNFLEVS